MSLDPVVLTFLQSWRFGGFIFFLAAANGILPYRFTIPSGIGDSLIGLTAPLAAVYLAGPRRRSGFIA